eukprot:2393919-Pyramimonas_sp.AAC.1
MSIPANCDAEFARVHTQLPHSVSSLPPAWRVSQECNLTGEVDEESGRLRLLGIRAGEKFGPKLATPRRLQYTRASQGRLARTRRRGRGGTHSRQTPMSDEDSSSKTPCSGLNSGAQLR